MATLSADLRSALLLVDLQNDFLHPDGAYGRAGQGDPAIAAIPHRIKPLLQAARAASVPVISTHFTLVPGMGGEPIVSDHLKSLRPFLARGDFVPGAWGHALVDELAPSGFQIEKVAYSAFHATRLEWVLRKLGVEQLIVCGIVTNGGVASTVRDGHVREYNMVVVEDGCAAFGRDVHETAIAALKPVAHITDVAAATSALSAL